MNRSSWRVLALIAWASSFPGVFVAAAPPLTGVPIRDIAMHPASSPVLTRADNDDLQPQKVDGFPAWVAVPHDPAHPGNSSVYFLAPDSLRNLPPGHAVRVELIYHDEAAGQYNLTYDSQDPQVFPPNAKPGAGKPATQPLTTTGSKEWKSVRWVITDPRFAGNLNGADLKLESQGPLPLTVAGIYIDTVYDLTDDSKPQPGVPHGDVMNFAFKDSKIFPGTMRHVTVYVPKQYDGATPACVWVNQDGMIWQDNVVFDNLIARKEVPVIIDISISPGSVPYPGGKDATGQPVRARGNRQYEYDEVSDDYPRFLLEEIFPFVEQQKTPDGRAIRLSRDGNDCGIGGTSSGGIAAFNAAWQRPESFTRVLSAIGSFDDLQEGDRYPDYIRKTEPKPIRVFIQDNDHDLNWFAGDWFYANQRMFRALTWAGYETDHLWGDRGHDAAQAIRAFPDIMRYLWKGWPARVPVGETQNTMFERVFHDNPGWQQVWSGPQAPPALAVNAQGEIFFNDLASGAGEKIGADGKVAQFVASAKGDAGECFGSDGRLYQIEAAAQRIVAYDAQGTESVFLTGLRASSIVALPHQRFYVSEPGLDGAPSRIWLVGADGSKKMVDTSAEVSSTLAIDAPAYATLWIGDGSSPWLSVCDAMPDGTLVNRQHYTLLETLVTDPVQGAHALVSMPGGEPSFAATALGVQIHQGSSVKGIVPVPGGPVTGLVLGGPGFDTFYAISGHAIYARKSGEKGAPPPSP